MDGESSDARSASNGPSGAAFGRAVAEMVDEGVFELDADGRVAAANDALVDATGFDRATLTGRPVTELVADDRASEVEAAVSALPSGDDAAVETLDVELSTADDGRLPVELRLRAVDGDAAGDAAGEPGSRRVVGVARERSRHERERFRTLVQEVEEYAIFMLDADGHVETWNEGAKRIKGYDAAEIVGEHFSQFYTPEDREAGVPGENLAKAAENGRLETEGWRVRKDGSEFWADVVITPLFADDGSLRGYAKVTRDMTERREREQKLRRERDLNDRVLSSSPVGIAVMGPDGTPERANQRMRDLLGLDPKPASEFSKDGMTVYDADGDRLDPSEFPSSRVFETGEPVYGWEGEVEQADGERRWVSANAVPLRDDDGDVERVLVSAEDVTDHVEREQKLRQERDLVEGVIETSPVSILVVNRDGEVEKANSRAKRRLGIPDDGDEPYTVGDRPIFDEDGEFVPPEERPYTDVFETGEPVEDWQCQIETVEGERRWMSINAAPMPGDEDLVVVTGEDVTDLKETQRKLAQRRDELESELGELFGRITDAFLALDDEWNITYVNERAAELTDREETELLGESIWDAFPEAKASTFQHEYERAMETQESVTFEEYFPPLDTWFHVSAYPSESGLSLYFRDVTDRRQYEQTLAALHGVTRDLLHAESKTAVAERVVDAASDLLDLPGVALYLHDEDAGELSPAAYSDDMPELYGRLPTVAATAESSVTGRAFVGGETVQYEDVSESELLPNDEAVVRRTLFIPLGDHGILVVGDDEVGGFDDRTVELAELLTANAESAMDRVDRERALEESERRYRTLAEQFPNGLVAMVDDDLRFTVAGGEAFDRFDYDAADIEGLRVEEVFEDDDLAERLADEYRTALDGESRSFEVAYADHEWLVHAVPVEDTDGDVFAGLVMAQDVTERKQRERGLEQYRTIAETASDVFVTIDDRSVIQWVNPAVEEMLGYQPSELEGEPLTTIMSEDMRQFHVDSSREYLASGTRTLDWEYVELLAKHRDGSEVSVAVSFSEYEHDDQRFFTGIIRDVTERKRREQELRDRMRQQEVTAELGRLALEESDIDRLFEEATELVADTLDVDYCKVLDLDEDAGELLLRQGVGWDDGVAESATVAADERSQAGYTLQTEGTVVVENLDAETRFSGPDLLLDHDVESGMSVVIGSADEPWGVLGAHDRERREFSEHDANFLESVANVLATAVERNRRIEAIERQRQHLAALDSLNGVVQDINAALVESSTREEIERVVCERLVEAAEYRFAWIGRVDRNRGLVTPSVWAGEGEAYLDGLEITLDDSATAEGPTARAVEEMAMQTTPDFETDDAMEPWRDAAVEHGFESSAAIPLVYEGALYGVLNVYAPRPAAFEGREGEVVAQLSEVVGHAIRSVERKEALMSENVVELEFRSQDVVEPLLDVTVEGGVAQFERTVQTDEGSYLQYVTVEGLSESAFRDAVERSDVLSSARLVTDLRDGLLFEVTLDEPPLTSTVASHGGRVRETVVADGELDMLVEVPHSVDIRTLVGALEAEVPDVELVSQRSTQRGDDRSLRQSAMESLTDKQLAAVEAAFYAGYFDWPRDSTAEDLAESMGVSPPTLHQHLRKGERKLLADYFER